MLLYHWTRPENVPSIVSLGLLPERSTGHFRCVWLSTRAARDSLRWHVALHQGCNPAELVLFLVNVPEAWLTRHGRYGVYRCTERIAPDKVSLSARFVDKRQPGRKAGHWWYPRKKRPRVAKATERGRRFLDALPDRVRNGLADGRQTG